MYLVRREDGWLEKINVECRNDHFCDCLMKPCFPEQFPNLAMKVFTCVSRTKNTR